MTQAGLCESCVHMRLVRSIKGSVFYLCQLSRANPAFPKYPRLPVLECSGYQKKTKPSPATPPSK